MTEDVRPQGLDSDDASEPSSTKLILALSLAGLISGLVLVGAYELTLPRILANQARDLREAVFKVLPGVERFQPMAFIDGTLQPVEDDAEVGDTVYAGFDSQDKFVGYAIPGEGVGFQDTIRLIYGYEPDERVVVGMEVLESRETPGLGDRIVKDPVFKADFSKLSVDPEVVPVPTGTRSAPNEVDTITGATISSKAVVSIINATNERWLPRLSGPPGVTPPADEPAEGATSPEKKGHQEER
jgi:electron transport complex protein RnfG